MPEPPVNNDFLEKLTQIIEANISNELFGVSELAEEINMSRSNLLRKIKKHTNLSVSQFISQVRLKRAMEILKQSSLTVSEVSYQVGFSSTSYFIKCFREYYGYPPGEVGKGMESPSNSSGQITPTHQLAAIMFTDIEGYTALMQQNEEKAIRYRSRHREVFESITQKYMGKILQYYGDGTLSTFGSAIDATKCGIDLQLAFREEPRIPVRIGIHTGDILFSEDGIIGDGVNVASRIESLAVPQSVFISEKVHDEVKNQPDIQTRSMGVHQLKNVDKPMEVFAIANTGLIVPDKQQVQGKVRIKDPKKQKESAGKFPVLLWSLIIIAVAAIGFVMIKLGVFKTSDQIHADTNPALAQSSIAVLPFMNDSNDSSNVYIINGLMEATLNNLQKIKNLRVISRMSVEKYRNNPKSIPEIGRELNVRYLIEGSGQKIGDQIMLHIQLIDATNDQHIWSEQYKREVGDIFDLQTEVAKNITDHIEVFISPEEEKSISKQPTEDLVAYDYFLKGLEFFRQETAEGLHSAISWFEKAIEQDPQFAQAYANIAIAYYFLDAYQVEKKYTDQINHYADQALLFDDTTPQSQMAKGLYYIQIKEYELGISFLEKALEYNPNSIPILQILSDIYANVVPNTEKYLQYALKGISMNISNNDSSSISFVYLHVSNAFMQSGFVDEAEHYVNKSLDFNPNNIYSNYLRAYILLAKDKNYERTKDLLLETLTMDTTRLDVIQEVGKIYYYLRDFESSYYYYQKFLEIKETHNLDVYHAENAKIAYVMSKLGMENESEELMTKYQSYVDLDHSIYKDLSLSAYYSYRGEVQKSLEHLRLFSEQDDYFYWVILFLDDDPLLENIIREPEFKKISKKINNKFWQYHERVKNSLENEGVI